MANFKDIFKVAGSEEQAPVDTGDVNDRIKQDIEKNPILIYMKGTPASPQCGFSAAIIEVFESLQFPYQTRNVLEDPAIRQGIKEFSQWPTIPQVFVKGDFIGGCDIVLELNQRGELKTMVTEALKS